MAAARAALRARRHARRSGGAGARRAHLHPLEAALGQRCPKACRRSRPITTRQNSGRPRASKPPRDLRLTGLGQGRLRPRPLRPVTVPEPVYRAAERYRDFMAADSATRGRSRLRSGCRSDKNRPIPENADPVFRGPPNARQPSGAAMAIPSSRRGELRGSGLLRRLRPPRKMTTEGRAGDGRRRLFHSWRRRAAIQLQ